MTPRPADDRSATIVPAPVVDPLLFVHTSVHRDLERQRIATENRLHSLTSTEPDADGVIRGFGLTLDHPDVARMSALAVALRELEHQAELTLRRSLRRSPLHPWIRSVEGLGDKQVARLLGAIGDPYWNLTSDRPRTVSQLWAYCGLHTLDPLAGHGGNDTPLGAAGQDQFPVAHTRGATRRIAGDGTPFADPGGPRENTPWTGARVAARRRRGQPANWSSEAKTRAYLCATSCIKRPGTPYREIYLNRRAHTAVTHPDWTLGHSHNDALRILSKRILRDLWREARNVHHSRQEGAL